MAKGRAIHLADFAGLLQRSLEVAAAPLTLTERNALFRRRLVEERDRMEALHVDILARETSSDDKPGRVVAIFEEIRRCSSAVATGGMPNPAALERLKARGLELSPRCLALWEEEVSRELAALGLEDNEPLRCQILKIIHEARIAGVDEFLAQLADPASGYVRDNMGIMSKGGEAIGPPAGALPVAGPDSSAVGPTPSAPTHSGVPLRLQTETGPAHHRTAVPRPSAEWATVSVVEAAQRYIAAVPRTGGGAPFKLKKARSAWEPKTRRQFESAAMLLGKAHPGPIWTLTQDDLDRFAQLLDRLPARSHHKCERHTAMSLEAIAEEAAAMVRAGDLSPGEIGLMPPTTNRHFRFLRALCDWVRERVPHMAKLKWDDYLIADDRDPRDQRHAFTPEQGRQLFALPTWTGCASAAKRDQPGACIIHDAGYWVPLLCWYTGARREEIAKLMVGDVCTIEGTPCLQIDFSASGRIKTASSKRPIPIARELLRLGFKDYVTAIKEAGQDVLFPDLIPGGERQSMGDVYYKRYWRSLARHMPSIEWGQALHAFRHMVETELKEAEIFPEQRSDLLGHTTPGAMTHRYSMPTRLRKLNGLVNRIPIVTPHLDPRPITLNTTKWRDWPTTGQNSNRPTDGPTRTSRSRVTTRTKSRDASKNVRKRLSSSTQSQRRGKTLKRDLRTADRTA